ncbi:MAG: hypothetical protein DHS20C18_47120 [Saprospiraceae bacterium]|nr:MAG: hypothetical protein DHS20C18_47120 [Saprospiraceae bacterium]
MEQSKLVELVDSLEKKEKAACRKFLQSPYFNHREDVLHLFNWILKQRQRHKKQAFQRLFPNVEYDEQQLSLVMSYLLRLIEQFLAVQTLLEDKIDHKFHLLKNYQQRNLPKHFHQTLVNIEALLEKSKYRDKQYYESYRDYHWANYLNEAPSHPDNYRRLEALSEMTDIAYFSQKLRQICLLTAHQSVYVVDNKMIDQINRTFFPYLEQRGLTGNPAIGIYYHGYFVLQDSSRIMHFRQFKELLFTNGQLFKPGEVRELYVIAINYCVKQVNKGDQSFFKEMLSLYQEGLTSEVLIERGRLSHFVYHNAVAAALQTQEFEWAKSFIFQYKKVLDEKQQESAFQFNLARLAFAQHAYEEALGLLNTTYFQDVLLNLGAKTIMLKIFYLLQEFDLLDAHLNAMNNYIRRNRLIGYHKTNYLNIIRYTKKILSLNFYDKTEVSKLQHAIESESVLTEKEWLLEQTNRP